jgi:hypothetical protein
MDVNNSAFVKWHGVPTIGVQQNTWQGSIYYTIFVRKPDDYNRDNFADWLNSFRKDKIWGGILATSKGDFLEINAMSEEDAILIFLSLG